MNPLPTIWTTPGRGLVYSLPIPSTVVHPQPTTGARHHIQVGLRAVMGLQPQSGPNSIAIHGCLELRLRRQA